MSEIPKNWTAIQRKGRKLQGIDKYLKGNLNDKAVKDVNSFHLKLQLIQAF